MFKWIQSFADWLIYTVLNIESGTRLGEALDFFVYDTLKILLLLVVIVYFMGIVNSYFPTERLREFLHRKKLFGLEYLLASLFGALTPFCSCSSVPLFIGFVQGGIPLGVTLSFLITSPLVNEIALAMFIGMFGVKTTLIYALTGILLGTMAGYLLGKLNLDPLLTDWVRDIIDHAAPSISEFDEAELSARTRFAEIYTGAKEILRGVVVYVIVGVGIGAAMHGYIPEDFFTEYLVSEKWWTIPLSVLVAVPLYTSAAAIVPVVEVFVAKGIPLGTAITFMMAAVGLSFPEAMLLKKVMNWSMIGIVFGLVGFLIILSGYLFNAIL